MSLLCLLLSVTGIAQDTHHSKPFIKMGNGYISYNWTYRAGNDSSVIDNNVSQHVVTGSFNATIAQSIPVRVTWFERHSNSPFFRDFRDVTVDIDVQRYQQLRIEKAMEELRSKYQHALDTILKNTMSTIRQDFDKYKKLLNDPGMITRLIRARETLIRTDFAETSAHSVDSVKRKAREFICYYDSIQAVQAKFYRTMDSLNKIYAAAERKVKDMSRLFNRKSLSVKDIEQLAQAYGSNDKSIQQLRKTYSGIRKLSLGRTYPNFTNLTLQNINVNGINLEYTKGRYYMAASAGLVDFRIRDFLFSQQKPVKQYVYSARIGYGRKESDHVILTYFRGRKQLFGGNLQNPSSDIQGISVYGQILINKYIRFYGEVAQSGVPYAIGGNNSSKPSIAFNDHSQRAYAAGFYSSIPKTQTIVEGYYQHTGLNYQSFNSFQYNATANSWFFKADQLLWKRQLSLQASFRKNDFVNPLVLQHYDANTVFKSFTATFKKVKWPLLSVGYLPASQYTAVGNQVYENHYQTLMGSISHQYKLGIAKASTLISFSRFYNDSRDTGLVYFNATNFFVGQSFYFKLFTASVNVSGMDNGRHKLIVMEETVSATFLKVINAGFGIKINNLDRTINKIGFNSRVRAMIKYIGELNIWMERSYLPALKQEFYKYEVYNIGLIRYFK